MKLALKRHNGNGNNQENEVVNQATERVLPQTSEEITAAKAHVIKSPMVGTFYRSPPRRLRHSLSWVPQWKKARPYALLKL